MADIAARRLCKPIVIEDSAGFERRIDANRTGSCWSIAPWNYPYMTAINTVAPALIAGNAVMLKHATQTLLVGERMVRAFTEAGVPADVFQNIFLDHATTSALIAAGIFEFVNFTGSVGGGARWNARRRAPSRRWRLELGGKDPGYVMDDADLDAAVDTLDRRGDVQFRPVLLRHRADLRPESLFDGFVEKAVAMCQRLQAGQPARSGNHARSHGQ